MYMLPAYLVATTYLDEVTDVIAFMHNIHSTR